MQYFSLFLILTVLPFGRNAKILGFFTLPSFSHHMIFRPIYRELAMRGHNVTVINPHVMREKPLKNLKEIDVHQVYDVVKKMDLTKSLSKDATAYGRMCAYSVITTGSLKIAWENEDVKTLFESDETFDILLVQAFDPLTFSIASRYRVPIIGEYVN